MEYVYAVQTLFWGECSNMRGMYSNKNESIRIAEGIVMNEYCYDEVSVTKVLINSEDRTKDEIIFIKEI